MKEIIHIPEPFLFSPLKHYLPYIKDFAELRAGEEIYPGSEKLIRELRHIGKCVMDVYKGEMSLDQIFSEIRFFLLSNRIYTKDVYCKWAGTNIRHYQIIRLSDGSHWILKYYENEFRYVHIFPSRSSSFSFRVKANTLKSALLYNILIGKDYISKEDMNKARALAGLSPVKDIADVEAITKMIEILREF